MSKNSTRLNSIDMLRGLVIVIMALDHVRDMLATPAPDGLDFSQAGFPLFFTRWVTHLCAPTFVLLAGVSAYLYGSKGRSQSEVARFLVSRGIWLIIVELTIINFAWNFNIGENFFPVLQVIWVLGVSMIFLAGMLWLPRYAIFGIGITMILGHNLLDSIQPAAGEASSAWLLFHMRGLISVGDTPLIYVVYPLIPWLGVMMLGYCLGPFFVSRDATLTNSKRPKNLVLAGIALCLGFVVLRALDLYGDPNPWQMQSTLSASLIDFLNTTKYPPSLLYLLMTLGPALVLLGLFEKFEGRLGVALTNIGRVPFFFYVVHLYFIHLLALGLGLIQGFPLSEIAVIFFRYPPNFGISLAAVYLCWALIVCALYFPSLWFARLKQRRNDWWLSYL